MTTAAPLSTLVRERRDLPPPALRRALREAAHVSLDEIAQEIGVTRQAVARWEQGTRFPRPPHLYRYAEVLRTFQRESA